MQKFEKGFFVGAATAAHQVEGNNIHSDYWAQEQLPHTSFTEPSGIACDHYNKYEEDIKLLADASLNAYRFSICGNREKAVRFDVWRFPGSYDRGFEERHYCL